MQFLATILTDFMSHISEEIDGNNTQDFYHKDDYQLLNRDVELCGKYFDVVPDGNLFTLNDYPIFAIRMRSLGVDKIMNMYQQKYNFKAQVLTYKINENQYLIYSSDLRQMLTTQKEQILNFFDFSKLEANEFRGLIIVITNREDRTMHAIPYVYGKVNGEKVIIFLDSFTELNCWSSSIVSAGFFKKNIPDIKCYCHGDRIQADHHSCGIIACDFLKNCLKKKAKLTYKILKSVKLKTEIFDGYTDFHFEVNVFELPSELKKFSQLKVSQSSNLLKSDENDAWLKKHVRKLLYRRDPEAYNPQGQIVPDVDYQEKDINTAILEKGHKYAEWIIKDVKISVHNYNPRYWLAMIREKNTENALMRLIKGIRKLFSLKKV